MVERYNQPAIESLVTGTAGVNPAAGKSAELVSKLATDSVNKQFEFARSENQAINSAATNITDSAFSFAHTAIGVYKERQKLKNQQAVQNAEIPMYMSMQKEAIRIKQSGVAPDQWGQAFADQKDDIVGGALGSASLNHSQLPLAQSHANTLFLSQFKDLMGDGEKASYNNVVQNTELQPSIASAAISDIPADASMQDKLSTLVNIQNSYAANVAKQAQLSKGLEGKVPQLQGYAEKTLKVTLPAVQGALNKQFFSKVIAELPEGDAGLAAAIALKPLIEKAKFHGEGEAEALSSLNTRFNAIEGGIVQDTKADGEKGMASVDGYKVMLAEAFRSGNQNKIDQLGEMAKQHFFSLQADAKSIENTPLLSEKNPNGITQKVKTARLTENLRQQSAWASGLGTDVKTLYSLQNMDRAIQSFGMRITSFNEGQVRFDDYMAKKTTAMDKAQHDQAYENAWQPLGLEYEHISHMQPGKARQEAALTWAGKVRKLDAAAHQDGVIKETRFFSNQGHAEKLIDSSFYAEEKPSPIAGFFGAKPTTVSVTKAKASPAQLKRVSQFADQESQGHAVGEAVRMGHAASIPALDKTIQAKAQSYVHQHYPAALMQMKSSGAIKNASDENKFKASYLKHALQHAHGESADGQ